MYGQHTYSSGHILKKHAVCLFVNREKVGCKYVPSDLICNATQCKVTKTSQVKSKNSPLWSSVALVHVNVVYCCYHFNYLQQGKKQSRAQAEWVQGDDNHLIIKIRCIPTNGYMLLSCVSEKNWCWTPPYRHMYICCFDFMFQGKNKQNYLGVKIQHILIHAPLRWTSSVLWLPPVQYTEKLNFFQDLLQWVV